MLYRLISVDVCNPRVQSAKSRRHIGRVACPKPLFTASLTGDTSSSLHSSTIVTPKCQIAKVSGPTIGPPPSPKASLTAPAKLLLRDKRWSVGYRIMRPLPMMLGCSIYGHAGGRPSKRAIVLPVSPRAVGRAHRHMVVRSHSAK